MSTNSERQDRGIIKIVKLLKHSVCDKMTIMISGGELFGKYMEQRNYKPAHRRRKVLSLKVSGKTSNIRFDGSFSGRI